MNMIESYTLKNYRSFVNSTTIELRPLTLFFGDNNSGKSTLLRALPLIMDSLKGHSATPINLGSPALNASIFRDLLYRKNKEELGIGLSVVDSANNYHLNWTILDKPKSYTHIISRFSADRNGKEILNTRYNEVSFNGLLPEGKNQLFDEIKVAAGRVQWLTSVRTPLQRNNNFGESPKLQHNGQGVANILAHDNLGQKALLYKVSNWYEEHYNQRLVIKQDSYSYRIMCEPLADSTYQINIVDVGGGVAQVLPVIVASAMASEGEIDILAIEEPESFLHPRLQIALAAHFCELARQPKPPKVLLETHSEQVLLRVQVEIAKGILDPNLVLVYWVHKSEDGHSVAEKVTFDEFGRPQGNWPRNMFHEAIEQSRQLIQARRDARAE